MKIIRVIFSFGFILTMLCSIFALSASAIAISLPSAVSNYQTFPGKTTSGGISVENSDSKPHTYLLKIKQLPNEFKGYFTLNGNKVDRVDIPASQKLIIEFNLDTPVTPSITEVIVQLQFTRDDGVESSLYVSYTLNKDFALEISSHMQSIKALKGTSVRIEIGIKNTGNKELTNIKLNADTPYKWVVEKIEPSSLNLKPNESGVFVLHVIISASQQAGEFPVKATCSNADITSNQVTVPVTLSTSINYFWWVAAAIAVLLAFTILYFRKHGRR